MSDCDHNAQNKSDEQVKLCVDLPRRSVVSSLTKKAFFGVITQASVFACQF